MTSTDPSARSRAIDAARAAARNTIERFALDQGATIIARPAFRGSDRTVKDVDPIAGLRAAHDLEHAVRNLGRDYARYARETGHTWRDIGVAMNLTPDRDAGESIAEAAFTYAVGSPDTDAARSYGRSVSGPANPATSSSATTGSATGQPTTNKATPTTARASPRRSANGTPNGRPENERCRARDPHARRGRRDPASQEELARTASRQSQGPLHHAWRRLSLHFRAPSNDRATP